MTGSRGTLGRDAATAARVVHRRRAHGSRAAAESDGAGSGRELVLARARGAGQAVHGRPAVDLRRPGVGGRPQRLEPSGPASERCRCRGVVHGRSVQNGPVAWYLSASAHAARPVLRGAVLVVRSSLAAGLVEVIVAPARGTRLRRPPLATFEPTGTVAPCADGPRPRRLSLLARRRLRRAPRARRHPSRPGHCSSPFTDRGSARSACGSICSRRQRCGHVDDPWMRASLLPAPDESRRLLAGCDRDRAGA